MNIRENSSRRAFLKQWPLLTGAASVLANWPQLANARNEITKVVVGYPVGGTADGVARALTAAMSCSLNQTAIVDNRPGASGQIGAQSVRQSPPDGLTLLLTPCSVLTLTPLLYSKPMFDGLKDFAPILSLCEHGFGLAVSINSPIQSLADFKRAAQQKMVSYGTPGVGSGPHLLGSIYAKQAQVQLNHVAYRGVAPGLQDLMGGQIDACIQPLSSLITLHKTGRVRILATTLAKRHPSIDQVPTFAEQGHTQLELIERYGLFAPPKTPQQKLDEIQQKVLGLLPGVEMQNMAKSMDIDVRGLTQLQTSLEAERVQWAAIVKATGVTLDS